MDRSASPPSATTRASGAPIHQAARRAVASIQSPHASPLDGVQPSRAAMTGAESLRARLGGTPMSIV
ncbi:MAG TPA: hypothetical protein DFS52_27915 [Myxococcales bacterium]|nr:hypothetical protein [Myxococcales bacterium]